MAKITKAIQEWQPLAANLIPAAHIAKMSQDELLDRLAFQADLTARADRASNPVLASAYGAIAKAVGAAAPRDEVEQQARGLRAKAAMLGPQLGDHLLRMADDLERRNPAAPRRAAVRKAAAEPVLMPVYDIGGKLVGAVDEAEVIPVTDAEIVAKAASAGMTAVFSEDGKPLGLTRRGAVQPVSNVTVQAGGTTGMGQPRMTGPPASLPFNGPQARLPGDVADRTVVKAAGRESAGGVPDGRVAAYTSDGRFLGYVRPDAKFPAGTPDAEGPSAGPGRIDLTSRQVAKAAQRAPRHPDGRVVLLRDLPPRSARRKG